MAARILALRPLIACVVLLTSMLSTPACVQFQPAVLYSGVEQLPPPERPRKLSLAVEPIIYEDQNDDTVWFQDDERCTQGSITTDVVYEGDRAVEVSWNRGAEGCDWAGLGFGWDDWAGKDLSEILPYAAIEFHVRSKEGNMYALPMVLTLEDYSGGMGFSYTGNKYFERPFIDEHWQRVVVPLSTFDLDIEHLDPTNVKQLIMELQQSGGIYLDDIRLIYFEEEEQEPWLVEAPRPDPTALPITLFDDAFINNNGWGLLTDRCQTIELTDDEPAAGTTALHARWDVRPADCYEAAIGVSWADWFPVDLTPIALRAAVQFDVKLASGTETGLPLRIALEDYSRRLSSVSLQGSYLPGDFTSEWQTITIPMSDFRGDADFTDIKDLVIYMEDAGDLFLDNIRLVEIE